MWLFDYFNFERNYDVSKSESPSGPCILLNKNVNFSKSETESKIENTTHSFRETNLVLQLIFKLFQHLCFVTMYTVLNTLSEHTYFYISKNIFSYTFFACIKIVENLQCILKCSNKSNRFYFKMESDEETATAIVSLLLVKKIRKREKDLCG